MTAKGCNKLMAMIKANYPAYHAKTDEETQKAAVNIMACVLEELEPKDCEMALLQYMSEPHEFPPTAGQIRDIACKIQSPWGGVWLKRMIPAVKAYHDLITRDEGTKGAPAVKGLLEIDF